MSTVFANGLEVSSKAQSNKVIAATPDTCMTPPENPATPPGVPVPYPSFGTDGDLSNGTSTVKIGGKTVSHKNKSYFSKSTGTEAGSAAKKGVITSTNKGKVYAAAWSNDVKAEGDPVARFSDRATVNHASPTPNDGNGSLIGKPGKGSGKSKRKCLVGKYKDIKEECNNRSPKSEAHHIIPDMIYRAGSGTRIPGAPSHADGICICITKKQHSGLHKKVNAALKALGKAKRNLRTPTGRSTSVQHTASVGAASSTASSYINDKDIPGLPKGCAKKARDQAKAQNQGINRQPARTNPQRAPRKNSVLQRVLRRGHY